MGQDLHTYPMYIQCGRAWAGSGQTELVDFPGNALPNKESGQGPYCRNLCGKGSVGHHQIAVYGAHVIAECVLIVFYRPFFPCDQEIKKRNQVYSFIMF